MLNAFYFLRFYYKANKGYFDKDHQNSLVKDGWNVTFHDEFNKPIDFDNKWNKWYSERTLHKPDVVPSLNSLDCIEVKNNQLHLYTKTNEDYPNKSDYPLKTGWLASVPTPYWENGKLMNKGFNQQYGYFETNCKVPPNGLTFWAAFWLYGANWPPEIDIFEFMSGEDVGTDKTKGISMTTHWGSENKFGMKKATQLGRTLRKFLGISVNFNEHFHTYACKWEWDYIEWYIDNVAVYRSPFNVPDCQMHIVISNGAKVGKLPKPHQMPQDFIVNYVRAYKKIQQYEKEINNILG